MVKKVEKGFSNRMVFALLVLVLILSLISLATYFVALEKNSASQPAKATAQGKVSIVILPPEEVSSQNQLELNGESK